MCRCFLKSLWSSTVNDIRAETKNSEWYSHSTHELICSSYKIMLWSTCMCFLKSLWSSTLNDIHHMKFFAIHKRSCYGHMNHMNFFAIHKKSCYGQRACVFSSRWGLQLWMTFITWSFSLFIKNHVMVNMQVFSHVVVVLNFEWHSTHKLFRSS